eukprot:gnl/MRDRNA2_/MRDRNA2_103452_c0_seq1.p1 gnl/MRDRNA2_/MRDRNA2_103452_c0~~gnl/MRDRNA2_/MRDRNA2_103452_c0_seq1.p1  ORF type:complete len:125 (+),score=19.15 gnl/MRDRNA2_/MRDRNA2_103452_c0_seq1:113-487(+)
MVGHALLFFLILSSDAAHVASNVSATSPASFRASQAPSVVLVSKGSGLSDTKITVAGGFERIAGWLKLGTEQTQNLISASRQKLQILSQSRAPGQIAIALGVIMALGGAFFLYVGVVDYSYNVA